MSYTIALAGKGGTGKTTIAALLVKILSERKEGSILAVDADPNNNLGESLGEPVKQTIGSILDEIARNPAAIPSGMSKERFMEYKLQSAIVEADGFDLLSMGKPEGPGCYCYVNNLLRDLLGKLSQDYDFVIIDNEAGLEHFSRRTTRQADALLVISDASKVGLNSAKRISELASELELKVKKRMLIINRFNEEMDSGKFNDLGLEYLGNIPQDAEITRISLDGNSLSDLNESSVGLLALRQLGEKIWN